MITTSQKDMLSTIFTTVEKEQEKITVPCFTSEAMSQFINSTDKLNPLYSLYSAVSEAMRESNLSFNFSYEIATRAVDVLTEVADWKDDDSMNETIDGIVPKYTYDLMQIYVSDHWAVDEAVEELGTHNDSTANAQLAWYSQIEQMTQAIVTNLEKI